MSEQITCVHPVFQPRPGLQGLSTAYLCVCLAERVTIAESDCWEHQGTGNDKGYGFVDLKHWKEWPQSVVQLHRLVYRLCVGPIPDDMFVLHRCDNPPCVNPAHLFLGTCADNMADKVQKGRQERGEDHNRAFLTDEQIMEIRRRDAAGESPPEIASDFGVQEEYIREIASGKRWSHLPLLYTGDRLRRPCPKCSVVFSTRNGKFFRHVKACDVLLERN